MARSRKPKSAAQIAASKRNLAIARAHRKSRGVAVRKGHGYGAGVRRTKTGIVMNEFGMALN